jgi:hypothetical protein
MATIKRVLHCATRPIFAGYRNIFTWYIITEVACSNGRMKNAFKDGFSPGIVE